MATKIQDANVHCSGGFHGICLVCSVRELKQILGEPTYEQNTGEDKVNFEWVCQTQNGQMFTIYDWKEYREIGEDEQIEWHIGSPNKGTDQEAFQELVQSLDGRSSEHTS